MLGDERLDAMADLLPSLTRAVAAAGEHPSREQQAMRAVSRAVARGRQLSPILDRIAHEAAVTTGLPSASVLLARAGRLPFRLGGSFGLSEQYRAAADSADPPLAESGPSGMALRLREQIVIDDIEGDVRFQPWRELALHGGFRAMVSTPLIGGRHSFGALNVYRPTPGPWQDAQVRLLEVFADHAASAIRVAQLVQRQTRQLEAMEHMASGLRELTHEHANRIHAIRGLLELGEVDDARRLVALIEDQHHRSQSSLAARIASPTLSGLIQALMTLARQRTIELRLDRRSRLDHLPSDLGDLEAISLVGNLVQNAFDAVDQMPPSRRVVTLGIFGRRRETVIRVRDRGRGVAPELRDHLYERGRTTKPEHSGVGLSVVRDIVTALCGTVSCETSDRGTAFTVTIANVG